MKESVRLKLVEILQNEMGLNVSNISQDNAHIGGYRIFTGTMTGDSLDTAARVWTPKQLKIIEHYSELFFEWFLESAVDEPEPEEYEVTIEEFARYCSMNFGEGKVRIVRPNMSGIHHQIDDPPVVVQATLKVYA